ncbi:MAG: hypothetical protein JOZ93_06780, partial [Sinobacteraceae bacterium]|nr:hypothetical protein [Nevskiaceae bacterium]
MRQLMRASALAGCLLCIVFGVLRSTVALAAAAPYPQSRLITAVSWDLSVVSALRKAQGSDLWPLTWAADGSLYGAWGDGGGFDGDSNNVGRVSLGFARISGTPSVGVPDSYGGHNIWGAAPGYAQYAATFGGKVDEMLSVHGVLYAYGAPWTRANCNCSNPVEKPGDDPHFHTVMWSQDSGHSWQIAPWSSNSGPGGLLQYGQDYAGAADPRHVYFYFQRDRSADAGHLYLRRVSVAQLTADPTAAGVAEYFRGIDAQGAALWTASVAAAEPVYFDAAVPAGLFAGAHAVYDSGLQRYVLSTFHGNGAGQIGLFEASAPWGPWATIAYYDDWGGFNESGGEGNGLLFPSKWISADGKGLWAVFSAVSNGFDSFNVAHAVFTVPGQAPPAAAPVGSWSFDEGSGSAVHDDSGHGNGGTLLNGAAWTSGEQGSAVLFDAGRSALLVRGSASLANLYRRGLTVSVWVLPRAAGGGAHLLDKDGNSVGWFMRLNGTNVEFTGDQFAGRAVVREASAPLQLNVWQHVVVTWDGSQAGSRVHLYVDGAVADGSYIDGQGAPADDLAVPLTIGNRASDLARGFDGALDEVKIYDHAFSPLE